MTTRQPPQPPIDFEILPSFFEKEATELIAATTQVYDRVAAIPPEDATFANAILPLLHDEDARSQHADWLAWLRSTSPEQTIRDASLQFFQTMTDAANQHCARQDVFRVVDAVWRKQPQEPLDQESQLCLERIRHEFIELGLGLEDPTARARVGEIQAALPKLTREFISNLDNDASGIWLTLDELKGVPQHTLNRWKADGDKRWVDRRLPNINAVLKSAESAETRRKAWLDYENRVAGKNDVLLKEILLLRHELARLLGLKNWAEYREPYRLVPTAEALQFLQNFQDNLVHVGRHDVASLESIKEKHLIEQGIAVSEESKRLFLWDKQYYTERAIQSSFHVDTDKAAEYFPFTGCLSRLLALFSALFSISIEPARVSTWHSDVHAFTVWSRDTQADPDDDAFIGYLYLDPFPRDHKYGHKGTICIRSAFVRPDGTRNHPVSVVVTNYTPPDPSGRRPSLLKPHETVSLFHELGHALHHLLARSAHRRTHSRAMPRDFVEVPSIMLEHVFWSPEVVHTISGHYEDEEERLPEALLAGLLRSRWAHKSLGDAANLLLSVFDMRIHTPGSLEEIRDMNMASGFNKLRRELGQIGGPEELGLGWDAAKSFCRFRFPIGYAASYYAYVLSHAYSYDIFETKLRPYMPTKRAATVEELVSKELRDEFDRYRRVILEPGSNIRSLNNLLAGYLGREPSSVPYMEMIKSSMNL
ncbi:Peptidase M3A/M3B [Akanthomyces lecanii RCEF 1005]|uniref:Peptidase M3A/M3B n=1 Tax=Akanthomyces lecanii RCEF 1005 TaxID=1081108 RepID=A0A168BGY5_CORDF|nr:Peptidase M3A/M3B [Akanthomyces lecanii RCEF 1005]